MRTFVSIFLFWIIMWIPIYDWASQKDNIPATEKKIASNSDTIIYREIEEITVYPRKGYKINSNEYFRMVKKIRKVYPFAKEAAIELHTYNEKFKKIKDPRLKRRYIKKVEKDLFAKHENDIKHLTISEGRYLLLLIDRETGDTSYELVKEIKGSFSAFFWQGIAKVFGNNMKDEYDPIYKHFVIEQIVLMIEKEKS